MTKYTGGFLKKHTMYQQEKRHFENPDLQIAIAGEAKTNNRSGLKDTILLLKEPLYLRTSEKALIDEEERKSILRR